jgi:multidrug efflux system membrane fusion protein
VEIQGIGNVQASATVSVYSLLSGQIFQVRFKEGDDVKAGDLLFVIDPRPFETALQQAEATMAQHQAAVAQAEPIWCATRPRPTTPPSRRSATRSSSRAG